MPEARTLRDPVSLSLDGEPVRAERGEPVAVALLAAGHLALARSPKFHRPRGPWCLRAACDGCLARVDDVPNVMTCRVPAEEGLRVETQNVAGSRDTDLLRAADWFFPQGMNHHELLAGVPAVGRLMQTLARQVAGLGRLPGEPRAAIIPAVRRDADVLVVGCGPAGMAAALELASRGRGVEVVDDDLVVGGSLNALPSPDRAVWQPLLDAFVAASKGPVRLRLRTTAAGVYGADVLVVSELGAEVVAPRCLVLAPGAHDGLPAFEGNDLPGVVSARAAGRLLGHGVALGRRVVVTVAPGGGPFGAALAAARAGVTLLEGVPLRARGASRVRAVEVGGREVPCDLLVVDAPRAPAYELCAQAGADLAHESRGFVVRTDGGRIREGVFACGEVAGTPLDPASVKEAARAIADGAPSGL